MTAGTTEHRLAAIVFADTEIQAVEGHGAKRERQPRCTVGCVPGTGVSKALGLTLVEEA